MKIERLIERMQSDNVPIHLIAYTALHQQSGCRISDLLNVNYLSISPGLNISILQGKGSLPLIIQPVYFREYWVDVRVKRLIPMEGYNRFFMYRFYRKYGIGVNNGSGRNMSVTHAFRKQLAQDVYSIDNTEIRVQGALGHRSKKSTEHYIDNKAQKSKQE